MWTAVYPLDRVLPESLISSLVSADATPVSHTPRHPVSLEFTVDLLAKCEIVSQASSTGGRFPGSAKTKAFQRAYEARFSLF